MASATTDGMVRLEGGEFSMGSDRHYPDERPVRRVAVDGFWIDPSPVTNRQFASFVGDTGYRTVAELPVDRRLAPGASEEELRPGSAVFTMTSGPVDLRDWSQWWSWTPGADWRHPEGPESDLEGREEHPVVHVSYADALAYCDWSGKSIPTEAEWEYAARGGLDGAEFAWGDDDPQETAPVANTWQGPFPYENAEVDGWIRTSPRGTFPPNGFGLDDVCGNVWEWTDDWYAGLRRAEEPSCCVPRNPRGGDPARSVDPREPGPPVPRKVLKGGSHLCTRQYCFPYRPAARQPQTIDSGLSNLGFRCVVREV